MNERPQRLAMGWLRPAAWHTARTAEHVWTDVGGTPSLVLQQVPLAHEMLPEAEVGDGYPMRPGRGRHRVNTLVSVPTDPCCPHLLSREQRNHAPILSAPLALTAFLPHGCVGCAGCRHSPVTPGCHLLSCLDRDLSHADQVRVSDELP